MKKIDLDILSNLAKGLSKMTFYKHRTEVFDFHKFFLYHNSKIMLLKVAQLTLVGSKTGQ